MKMLVTAVVTFEVDMDDASPDLVEVDRVHDAALIALPSKCDLEEITGWEPAQ